MKPHRILKDFSGSHDGINSQRFRAGETKPLSDSLAAIVVREGWAEPVEHGIATLEGEPRVVGDGDPFENRDTKVIEPQERKPLKIRKK